MFKLIKKDIITTITSNKKAILEYLFILGFLYTVLNPFSYFTANIIISSLILLSTYRYDDENNAGNFILSMPVNKEKLVYSKYIMSFGLIVITSIINSIITAVIGGIFYRGPVLNDILISNAAFLIMISIILPIIFKFGYGKSRFYVGGISILITLFLLMILNLISVAVYSNLSSDTATILNYTFSGPLAGILSSLNNYLLYDMSTKYINLYTANFVAILAFLISMYISLKIVGNKNKMHSKKFITLSLIIIILFAGYIYLNKVAYGKRIHVEDYDVSNNMETEVLVDGYRELNEGTLIKIKIVNRSKYTYRLDGVSLNFGNEVVFEDGSSTFADYLSLYTYDGDINNNKILVNGIEPFGEGHITFLQPKGLKLEAKSFDFNNVNLNYSGSFTVNIPFFNIYTTMSSSSGSYSINYINFESDN